MRPFSVHEGVAVPLLRPNIDTDAIIPSREMRHVSKRGLGAGLFAGWRYQSGEGEERVPDPDFALNRPELEGASILLAGPNFGCGSSREHAVWALLDFGFRALIAPSFGAIFYNNCVRNGLLPVRLDAADVERIGAAVARDPQANRVRVDLRECRIGLAGMAPLAFEIAPAHREMLLEGLDPVALTLKQAEAIAAHQRADRQRRPWAYL